LASLTKKTTNDVLILCKCNCLPAACYRLASYIQLATWWQFRSKSVILLESYSKVRKTRR